MKAVSFAALCIGCLTASAVAQDSVVGRYNGSFTTQGINAVVRSVSIVITSVEDGKVTGTGIRTGGPCAGEYPLEGTFKGDEIRLRATKKGGPAGDCGFGFVGKVEGTKLVGKSGQIELTLNKN